MKRTTTLLFVLLAPGMLAGCQTLRAINPFRDRPPPYQTAQQAQPLQIPAGVQKPANNEALVIPAVAPATSAAVAAAAELAKPPVPAFAGVQPITATLALADSVDKVYQRVGQTLQQDTLGKIIERQDHSHAYVVEMTVAGPKKGFFYRLFHSKRSNQVQTSVTVTIASAEQGSVVIVHGHPEAVGKIMDALKRQLQ